MYHSRWKTNIPQKPVGPDSPPCCSPEWFSWRYFEATLFLLRPLTVTAQPSDPLLSRCAHAAAGAVEVRSSDASIVPWFNDFSFSFSAGPTKASSNPSRQPESISLTFRFPFWLDALALYASESPHRDTYSGEQSHQSMFKHAFSLRPTFRRCRAI